MSLEQLNEVLKDFKDLPVTNHHEYVPPDL